MQLQSINLARSIWLGPILDLNPKGLNLVSVLIPFLVETYKFKKFPSFSDIADQSKEWAFQFGDFYINKDLPIKVDLAIHKDGVVVDTHSSTVDSDAFINEMLTKCSDFLKASNYQTILKKKLYLSQLFVSTEKELQVINPKIASICKYLSAKHENRAFQLGGISFWPDQTEKLTPGAFTFERAAGVPFSENRYYSAAPLQTDQHIELLDKLEKLLS